MEPTLAVSERRTLPYGSGLYLDGVSPHFDIARDGRVLAIRGDRGDNESSDVRHVVDTGFLDEVTRLVPVD
jgi:hypothetical protein